MKYLLSLILTLPLNAPEVKQQYDYKLRGYAKVMTHNGNGYRYVPLFEPVMPNEGRNFAFKSRPKSLSLIERFPSRRTELERAYRGMGNLLRYPYGNPYPIYPKIDYNYYKEVFD